MNRSKVTTIFIITAVTTTLAILVGTTITTTNSAWAAPKVQIDSQSCDATNDNIKFSWSGFGADDSLVLNVYVPHKEDPLVFKEYQGTSDGSGSGDISLPLKDLPSTEGPNIQFELNAAGSGGNALAIFPVTCVPLQEHKK
jgi:hypothetical protein